MKRYIIFYLNIFLITAYAAETELFSPQKQNLLREEQNRYESEYEKLKYNWIAPINLNASYGYDKSAIGEHANNKKISASVSQDVFRSGGITYQIAYADAKKASSKIALDMEIASINEKLFSAILNYKKALRQKEQSELNLKNREIEIFIKQQLYDVGKADITELNNALMGQSSELKNLAAYNYTLAQQRYEISKISDINPDTFLLREFALTKESDYLQNNLELNYARSQSVGNEYLYGIAKSSYLPSVALNANIGYQDYDAKKLSNGYDGGFYGAGISVNVPLAYNSSATIEEAKSAHLKQLADVVDKERRTKASYAQSLELIQNYRSQIEITSKNLALYDELIATIKAGVDAGVKTGYDLQTLKNSKAIEEQTIKINEINIQLELAKLHFALKNSKDI